MMPPEAQGTGEAATVTPTPPAVLSCPDGPRPLQVLRQRADFLRAASARRQGTAGFLVQARARGDGQAQVRVGFTASKKVGNAVARNRAKRRLRALAREVLAPLACPGWDYVLVARPGATTTRPYAALREDLAAALRQIHKARP
jgi:ribonuclease P protein component